MGEIQITISQLDNYGSWTRTLGNDREHKIQILQAQLYAAIQEELSKLGGLAFFNRFDEMIAVTNGISKKKHATILSKLHEKFPLTLSMSIGVGRTPYSAEKAAASTLQKAGVAHSNTRRAILVGDNTIDHDMSKVQIAHIDVNGVAEIMMDRVSAYKTSLKMLELQAILSKELIKRNSLTFFLGGDNFMAVCNNVGKEFYEELFSRIYKETGLELKCGVGIAHDARRAASIATEKLDLIRDNGRMIKVLVGSDL